MAIVMARRDITITRGDNRPGKLLKLYWRCHYGSSFLKPQEACRDVNVTSSSHTKSNMFILLLQEYHAIVLDGLWGNGNQRERIRLKDVRRVYCSALMVFIPTLVRFLHPDGRLEAFCFVTLVQYDMWILAERGGVNCVSVAAVHVCRLWVTRCRHQPVNMFARIFPGISEGFGSQRQLVVGKYPSHAYHYALCATAEVYSSWEDSWDNCKKI